MQQQQQHTMAKWYIIHAYSGFENKVKEGILAEADRLGLSALVPQVEVPQERVVEVRRNKRVETSRNIFPGYVLAKMNLTDDVYHLVRNTPKVTGFLGPQGKPQAISEAEAIRILSQKLEPVAGVGVKAKAKAAFEIGDTVKVLEGPFASFNGVVEDIDDGRGRVKVGVTIFGRSTPVELEFEQVEKIK